ncbi:MAG: hypothetical protein QNJ40_11315 [Xanthomonadales bacterium]|nr:hypothetical protein [Xanthomonadales bacterium]
MRLTLTLLSWLVLSTSQAQNAAPCSSEQHGQFDFWIGSWTVYANGAVAGKNRIEKIHGCVLLENWTSATGNYSGTSLNIYDAGRKVWHQSWTDSSGLLLQLDGGFKEGSMTLRGERPAADGSVQQHQIQWTPQQDGSVRQVWTTSSDDGQTWQTAFDGHYRTE